MKAFETTARVGPDGNIVVPIGVGDAGTEVLVTVTPAPKKMTQDEWAAFVQRTAGSITDPTFERPDQGQFEERDPLE